MPGPSLLLLLLLLTIRALDSPRTEHDVVLLRQRGAKRAQWRLTPPLRAGQSVRLPQGASVAANALIGRRAFDVIKDDGGRDVTAHEPSLAAYVLLTQRLATPIYPNDANAIVSMLDIHPDRPGEFDDDDADDSNNNNNNNNSAREPFEVFEAGTGHGSLTLHLARAIHAANPPLPRTLREAIFAKKPAESGEKDQTQAQQSDDGQVESDTACGSAAEAGDGPPDLEPLTASDAEPAPASSPPTPSKSSFHTIPLLHPSPDLAPVLTEYLASRRAVLHTLDRNASHARHARRLVRQFRRAQYLGDVDFHTGDLAAYLEARLAARHDRPFLDRAVLDLPGPHRPEIAAPLIRALRSGALLAVFTPSVSQLAQFIQAWADPVHSRHRARQQQQQQHQASNAGAEAEAETAAAAAASPPPLLKVERIVELPTSVLLASPSALGVTDAGPGRPWDLRTAVPRELERQRSSASDDATDEAASAGPDELVQIMRPKVGDRVVGGGFVAVLRRRSDSVRPTENGEVQGMVAERQ